MSGEESSLEEIFCWRRCPVRAGMDGQEISAVEFLQSEIPGVLLARQHGKENHWEDVTS